MQVQPKTHINILIFLIVFISLLLLSKPTFAQNQNPTLYFSNSQLEVLLSKATVAYHAEQYLETNELLQKIISNSAPGSKVHVASLELQALNHRKANKEDLAAGSYKRLLQVTKPESQAPYHFEMGTIRFKQKKFSESKMHFTKSFEGNFNPGTSLFFLGLHELEEKNERKALQNFSLSKNFPDHEALVAVIDFYIGLTYLQIGKSESALRKFIDTKRNKENSSMVEQSKAGADKAIGELNRAATFMNAGITTQYDSNVQSNPPEVTNSIGLTNQRTIKSIVSANITHVTPPLRTWQLTPSYSFYGNYNYNSKTRAFNFITHTGSIYLFHQPYKKFTKGIKAQSSFSFKNSPSKVSDTLFTKYSLTEEIGPIIRYEMSPRVFFTTEVLWKPKHFYSDPTTGSSRRSGGGFIVRPSFDFITISPSLNPKAYLTYEWDDTKGTTYDAKSFGIGISNSMNLGSNWSFQQSIDGSRSDYYESNPRRKDTYLSARASLSRSMNQKWNLAIDGSYMKNISNQPSSYSYNRLTASIGINTSF